MLNKKNKLNIYGEIFFIKDKQFGLFSSLY